MPQERKCILGCKKTPTLFAFPSKERDPERRKKWKRLLGIKGKVNKRIFACQRHFSIEMAAGRRLRRNALPDVGVLDVDNELTDTTSSFLNQLNGSEVSALRQIGKILTTAVKKRQTTEFFCNGSTIVESTKVHDSETGTDDSCTGSECYDGTKETVSTFDDSVAEISMTSGKTMDISSENYTNNNCGEECSDVAEVIDIIRMDHADEECDDTIPDSSFSPEYIVEELDSNNDESLEELENVSDAPDNDVESMVMDEAPLAETEYVELPNPDEPVSNIPDVVTNDLNHDKSTHLSRSPKRSRKRRVKMLKKSVQTSPIRSESISPSREELTEEIKKLKAQIKVQDKEMREIYRRRGKLLKRLKLLKNGNDHQLLEGFCNRLPAALGRYVRKKVKVYYTMKTKHLSIPYIEKKTKEMEQVEYPTLYEDYE